VKKAQQYRYLHYAPSLVTVESSMKIQVTIPSVFRLPLDLLVALFFSLFLLAFAGCSQKDMSSENTKVGGVLYFGIEVPFHGFDISETGVLNPPTAPLNNLILELLFRMDKSDNLIPVLGLSATPFADGTIWEIKLRQGVFFTTAPRLMLMPLSTTGPGC